jgi:membrane protein
MVLGSERAESALWRGLATWLTDDGAETVRAVTERVERAESSGGLLGALLLVYGATRLFRALHRAVNQLWGVALEPPDDARGKAMAYGGRWARAIGLTVAVVIVVGVFGLAKVLLAMVDGGVAWALEAVLSGLGAFALFTLLFRVLPEVPVTMREAAVSALVSTALFAGGSSLVTFYLRHRHIEDIYDGAAAIVVLIVWVYYSAQVLFVGACVGPALRRMGEKGAEA